MTTVELRVVRYIEFLYPFSARFHGRITEPIDGRSIDILGSSAPTHAYGMRFFSKLVGRTVIGKKTHVVSSEPYDPYGTIYIRGRVYTLAELQILAQESASFGPMDRRVLTNVVSHLRRTGFHHAVLTRFDKWEEFTASDDIWP